MSDLLDKLHNDHKNFSMLLHYTERQLDSIENCDVIDFETLLLAIEYMKDYSDAIHHPLENIVFSYFSEHYGLKTEIIIQLIDQHKYMPKLTKKIIDMLKFIINEMPINRHVFCENLSEYIAIQKQHMNYEESEVYPILYKTMRENDWQSLNTALSNTRDPLFDEPIKDNYRLLLEKVNATI